MKTKPISIGCILAIVMAAAAGVAAAAGETLRVGTFDSRGVALAYGRSARPDCMLAQVAQLKREHEQAKKDGDEDRAKELEAQGPALQKQIHEQVFAGAPIDDILALIEDEMAEVAEAAGVDLIASGILHSGPGVEVVDITLEMCAPFEPDEKTVKMIAEVVATPPVKASELSHDH